MMDYKNVTQRIISKGEKIIAAKQEKKRRLVNFVLRGCLVSGSVFLCIGATAMLKLFIGPQTDNTDRNPIYTTKITSVSQVTENTSEQATTLTTVSTAETETSPPPEQPEEQIDPMITDAPAPEEKATLTDAPEAEEGLIQTTAVTIVTTEHTRALTLPPAAYKETDAGALPIAEETTCTTTTAEQYNYEPPEIFRELSIDGNEYRFNGLYLTPQQVNSFYIMWKTETQLVNDLPGVGEGITEDVEILGVNEQGGRQAFIIVYFRRSECYALYSAK